MSATAVVGLQWGDEAKGKIVDLLTPHFNMVARYQGGHNAGHRIVVDGEAFAVPAAPDVLSIEAVDFRVLASQVGTLYETLEPGRKGVKPPQRTPRNPLDQ